MALIPRTAMVSGSSDRAGVHIPSPTESKFSVADMLRLVGEINPIDDT
jgi:hypothetical protein